MDSVTVIETTPEFAKMIEQLSHARYIAIDTESNSFYAYHERICLIQISTTDNDYILDPLALKDLGPLGRILTEPSIEKIFHAASNDVLGLKRDFQFKVETLFDTAIACNLLGYKQLGLAKILQQHFGVVLNKKWQRYDWGKRPLREEQLAYASLDTHYLISLRHHLASDLVANNLWDSAKEAFEKTSAQELQVRTFHPEAFMQIRGAHLLDPIGKRILKTLYVYREREAQRRDRAPFRILSNETLVRLAHTRPQSIKDFFKVKGIPRSYQQGHGAYTLLGLIRKTIGHDVESATHSE
jgi:ribonuclease D